MTIAAATLIAQEAIGFDSIPFFEIPEYGAARTRKPASLCIGTPVNPGSKPLRFPIMRPSPATEPNGGLLRKP